MLTFFVLLALLGPLWLFFFSGRSLAMSDDYAAISSAALLALLLLLVVEFHLAMKEAATKVGTLRQRRKEIREQGGEPDDITARLDEDLVGQARTTLFGLFSAVLLAGTLILVCLWAAVDSHGPARWLAWTSWLSICWGFVITLFIALGKVAVEYLNVGAERSRMDNEDRAARREALLRLRQSAQGNDGAAPSEGPSSGSAQS